MQKEALTIKRVKVRNGPFTYYTYRIRGKVNGQRVRYQSKDKHEAEGELQRLRIEAANSERTILAQNTSLSVNQLREAESAFERLKGQSLTLAIDHFLATYREPKTHRLLPDILPDFLKDKQTEGVSDYVLTDYKRNLTPFFTKHAKKSPHEITSHDITDWLKTREHPVKNEEGKIVMKPIGKKRWNNIRSDMSVFFNWCLKEKGWVYSNPVAAVRKNKITRDIPPTLKVKQCIDLMHSVMEYRGGVMVPYFALCLFAGIRPDYKSGEIVKLAARTFLFDFEIGVIRISREVAKGRYVRGITIQPNLAEWFKEYPLDKFPICPDGYRSMVTTLRAMHPMPTDVLRHTFVTMHVAKFRSIGDVALQAGNKEQIVRQHYLNLATQAEGEVFWALTPKLLREKKQLEGIDKGMEQVAALKAAGVVDISLADVPELKRFSRLNIESKRLPKDGAAAVRMRNKLIGHQVRRAFLNLLIARSGLETIAFKSDLEKIAYDKKRFAGIKPVEQAWDRDPMLGRRI